MKKTIRSSKNKKVKTQSGSAAANLKDRGKFKPKHCCSREFFGTILLILFLSLAFAITWKQFMFWGGYSSYCGAYMPWGDYSYSKMIPKNNIVSPLGCRSQKPKPDNINAEKPNTLLSYSLISDQCNLSECLFNKTDNKNLPLGALTVTGYYVSVQREWYDQNLPCDGFVITSGSKTMIDAINSSLVEGGFLYSKNDLGQVIINLELTVLAPSEKEIIMSSTKADEVKLILLSQSGPIDTEVGACYSGFNVLAAQ